MAGRRRAGGVRVLRARYGTPSKPLAGMARCVDLRYYDQAATAR
jgi:hypothetical protein